MIKLEKKGVKPIIAFSVYDAFGAWVVNELEGVDFVLVGDSLSMVFKGNQTVRDVTLDEMLYHYRIVKKNIKDLPVILDLPYGSYEDETSLNNTIEIIKEEEIDGVMLEGYFPESMKRLQKEKISFMVHLGYLPKYHNKPKVIDERDQERLLFQSKMIERYGAFALKLELVKSIIARKISRQLEIPVLGVGAGPYVDGHILVLYDFLGLAPKFKARFVRKYLNIYEEAVDALKKLIRDIYERKYPGENETY